MVSRRLLLKLSALGTASFAAPLAYSVSNITMTHNTGNPIGSTSSKDLTDNTKNLDLLVNGNNPFYPDRNGVLRKSWKGMEGDFNAGQAHRESVFVTDQAKRDSHFSSFLDASGYEAPVPYTSGITLVRPTQTITYLGNEYRAKSEFVPLETTSWVVDEQKLKLVGDESLRQEVANVIDPSKGAALIGRGVITISSVMDLATVPRRSDITVILSCYHPRIKNGGGGQLYFDPTMPRSLHNGGTVFSPTVPWDGTQATLPSYLLGVGESDLSGFGCYVRDFSESYTLPMFGGLSDWDGITGFDNRPCIEASIKSVYSTVIPSGNYGVARTGSIFIKGIKGKRISGAGELHKMGGQGIFSFMECSDVKIFDIVMDGQIVRDEAENGSILDGARARENFAFAVSFVDCHDCEVVSTKVYDFAWDGLRATGTVAVGGATATTATNINFLNNELKNIRGAQLWMKAVSGAKMNSNYQRNDTAFAQKSNAIFAVEWCADVEIAHNRQYYIGDNGVGVGEPDNNNIAARNKRINVHDNHIFVTRYHSILIAQAEDSLVHSNTIHRGGAKSVMVGPSGAVTCGAITLLGGGSAPGNLRVKVHDNLIIEPYEHGIYALDCPGTSLENASSGLEIYGNTVSRFGKLVTKNRLASSGITTQLQIAPILRDNITQDGTGDGLRVFGDADICGHKAFRIIGKGVHIPADTVLGNTRLCAPLINCITADTTEAGICIWSKIRAQLIGCKVLRAGCAAAPTDENTTIALQYAGIALRGVNTVSLIGCSALECGSGGLVTQFCSVLKDTDGEWSKNGKALKTKNFKAGVYSEGSATASTRVTLINPVMDGGRTQYYPVRVLFGSADSVALEPDISSHQSPSLGITVKKLINI